jgi:hypothetical protein
VVTPDRKALSTYTPSSEQQQRPVGSPPAIMNAAPVAAGTAKVTAGRGTRFATPAVTPIFVADLHDDRARHLPPEQKKAVLEPLEYMPLQGPDVFALRHSNLNPFLFADIGLEPNGMMLQVVSLFARMGEDPWREAARLAGLPVPDAVANLARQIAEMPGGLWPLPAATLIAARLVTLLPKKVSHSEGGSRRKGSGVPIWLFVGLALIVAVALSRLLF